MINRKFWHFKSLCVIYQPFHRLQKVDKPEEMNKLITKRNLTIINVVIVAYFILLWFINFNNIDTVLIGVFRELLTIPFLIAQIVFLVIGIRYLIKNKWNLLLTISVLLLAVCTIITIGSFF